MPPVGTHRVAMARGIWIYHHQNVLSLKNKSRKKKNRIYFDHPFQLILLLARKQFPMFNGITLSVMYGRLH